jgi:signal transduction histidine kinase
VRPLSRLSDELQSRGPDDLRPVFNASRISEIGTVTTHLNRLLHELSDVLQRERQFTSDVAHELRTPLTTLNLELSLPSPDTGLLKQETSRLIRVVEQLLTLARLEQMQWKKQLGPVALSSIILDQVTRFQSICAEHGMTLTLDHDDLTVHGDATLLQVMIGNFLQNCLRYCPNGTDIQVRWRDQILTVADNGPGIPTARMETMTQRFTSLDQKGEGLGLGLSIALKIADLHGAHLALHDAQPGLRIVVNFGA